MSKPCFTTCGGFGVLSQSPATAFPRCLMPLAEAVPSLAWSLHCESSLVCPLVLLILLPHLAASASLTQDMRTLGRAPLKGDALGGIISRA